MPISAQDMERLRLGVLNRCHPKIRGGITFSFRPLTIAEVTDVTTQTVAILEKLIPAQKHSLHESQIYTILTLIKASELSPGIPGVTEDTLKMLTPDELGYLFREYRNMVELCNPAIETIPDTELQRLADEIKKKASLPTDLSSLQAVNLVVYLLRQQTSPTGK